MLDRSIPFSDEKAQLLDELTYAIKNNTTDVPTLIGRARMPTRYGEYSRRITTSGTMLTKC